MQPNFASPKRQKFYSAKIVYLTLYKQITLNSKLSTAVTVLMHISIFRDSLSLAKIVFTMMKIEVG